MPDPSKFWDRFANRYARTPVADEASYRRKLEITREYLRPDMEVLEFGCGTGSTALAHAPYVKHIEAIDISAKMIAIAEGKARAAGVANVSFRQGSIDDLDARDESLDAVLGLSILHLLGDRDTVIAKVHRMLRPGGVFVSNTACLGQTMRWFRVIAPVGRALGLLPLVQFFTESELRDSLTGAGFAIARQWQPGQGRTIFIVAQKA